MTNVKMRDEDARWLTDYAEMFGLEAPGDVIGMLRADGAVDLRLRKESLRRHALCFGASDSDARAYADMFTGPAGPAEPAGLAAAVDAALARPTGKPEKGQREREKRARWKRAGKCTRCGRRAAGARAERARHVRTMGGRLPSIWGGW